MPFNVETNCLAAALYASFCDVIEPERSSSSRHVQAAVRRERRVVLRDDEAPGRRRGRGRRPVGRRMHGDARAGRDRHVADVAARRARAGRAAAPGELREGAPAATARRPVPRARGKQYDAFEVQDIERIAWSIQTMANGSRSRAFSQPAPSPTVSSPHRHPPPA